MGRAPPAEWIICFTVAWPAVQFATGFFQEVGRTSASAVLEWIKDAATRARAPKRDTIITLRFALDEERYVQGMVVLPGGEDSDGREALEAAGILGSIAGLLKEEDRLPGLKRGTFVWVSGEWHLAWWTDGERVLTTEWYEQYSPDFEAILGFESPLLPSSDSRRLRADPDE